MPFPFLAAAQGAAALAPLFMRPGRRSRGRRSRAIAGALEEYRRARPTGYLTPEDLAYGERLRERGSRAAYRGAEYERGGAAARYGQLGLSQSPARFARERRIGADLQERLYDIGQDVEGTLFGIRAGREQFERQRLRDILGAKLGAIRGDEDYRALQESEYFNSLLEYMPSFLSFFRGGGAGRGGGGGAGTSGASGYDTYPWDEPGAGG